MYLDTTLAIFGTLQVPQPKVRMASKVTKNCNWQKYPKILKNNSKLMYDRIHLIDTEHVHPIEKQVKLWRFVTV